MEETQPFLGESTSESEHNSIFTSSKPGRLSGSITRWLNNPSPVTTHCAVFVATSLVWGCIIMLIVHFSPTTFESSLKSVSSHTHDTRILATETEYLTCGRSVQEAKEKGCQYDILSNHWVPGECADEFSIKEYQSDGSWFPYADENRTQLLTREELGDRKFYYTSMRDHIVHCAVLWRRQYRAFTEGWKYLDSIIVEDEHTMHCSQFLMDMTEYGPDFRRMPIKVFVGKAGCHVRDV